MAKRIVVRKDVLENVWDSFIEKAIRSHKYIRKIPNSKGGFYYVYPSDFKKPIKALLSIFGMKEEQIDNAYKNNEIKQAYGASKEVFASHLMEYLTNRATWNKFFSDKFNRDKYKTPVKFEPKKSELKEKVQNGEIKNNGKVTDKTGKEHNETKEKDFKSKWNNSLMRKIYSMYNPIPEDKKVENSENRVSGESVSFNGKVGKITKDFGNDYVFVQFDGGGMGRFKKTDLQNLNPTNQEIVSESDMNGDEIKENDSTLNTSNDTVAETTDTYADEVAKEKPGFNKVERAVITVLYNQIKKENPGLTDFGIARRIKEQYPELDAHGDVGKTMAMVKDLIWDSKITEDVATYINTKKVAEKTQEEKDREWHEKWDIRLADEFVKGKEKYLNAKPLVSNNAFIMFDKVWDSLKDKTRNEQIKGLYNMVKDDYQMSWNESLAYRKEGYSKEEVRFGYINAFLETKNETRQDTKEVILDSIQHEPMSDRYDIMGTDYSIYVSNDRDRNKVYSVQNRKLRDENNNTYFVTGFTSLDDARAFATEVINGNHPEKDLPYENGVYKVKNPAEEHENRSQAMMGNDNAKKYGLTDDDVSIVKRLVDKYNFTKEQFASSAARTGNIKSINDYAKEHGMKAYDVALDVYDIIINNKTEAVDEMITERDTSALSQAMMGNQNARKYGNLSEEANKIIENNNLPVNENGVVQPTETELKTSKEFFEKNRNQNYKFGKDQYGNYYIQMPGVDGYYYDEKGNRVDNAAMIHQRTYHDEYIPEEPNFVTDNMNGERIYLTEEMKQIMNSGDTEYHPVDPTYVKPESDSFIDDYIDTLTKEKDINSLKARKNAMKHIYEMGKDKGIHIIPVSGIMSNSGMVTNAILPIGESNPMSDNSILVDKTNKALIDFANHVIDTVEPANTPKGQNVLLSNPEKNVLSLAYEFEKRQDPTMSDAWYIEKVTKKLPDLAAKVDNWDEIKNINFGSKMFKDADAVQEIKDYVEEQKKEESNNNSALENYASGDGMWVNNYLRNPSLYESESGVLNETDKQFIADLDNATTTEIITDKKLYRAVDASAVFGNISDLDFENLQTSVVYGNKEKLYADKVDSLINGAINKEITEKGFMSTTKDENIAANWDGFTGSNKEVVMELNIPDGLTGKDMKDFDVEGDEQKEVLLPRNLDYKVTEITKGKNGKILVKADVLGVHGNHIAMLGNQNARKDGLTEDEADALEYYVQDAGYTYINDKLRGTDETPMEQNHIDAIKNIDNVIARNTVKEKTLYRGIGGNTIFPTMNPYEHRLMELYLSNKSAYDSMSNDEWFEATKYTGAKDNVENYLKDIVGKTFNEKGYMSTSKDIEQTKTFSDSYKNGITIEFQNIPENTHGVDLSEFDGARELRAENEVLLHRDLNYKITGAKSVDGKIVLTAEIIPESDAEKTQNRSEAMMGNDNAKGKHNVKPQTESEMKKEQKKEKEARKKAGLPNPGNNVGDRVSAIDDADTWNPNSENYRFKDTGYIAGSRKEMASMFIMERAKNGTRIDAHEIDFDGLEENPRAAEKLITKSNIFGEVDWDGLREKGMSGSTAFLIDRIYASAGSKPDESNAQARKQYVIALNGLRDRFEDCKTVPEVIDTLKEIREEIRGEYVEIKEMPEYKKITDKMKSLNEIMRNKRNELMGLSEQGSKTYNVERQKIIEKYIQKGKDEKKLRWNTRVSEYNIPKEYQEEYKKETKGLWDKAYEPWKKAVEDFKAELISRGVKEEDFFTGKKNMAGKPIEVSWYDYYTLMPEAQEYGALSSELDAYIKKMKVAVSMKNPLLEAWKSLGKRFTDILYSDSFNQHKYECTKGTYDNWEWLEKEVKVTEKKTGKEKKRFQLKVANSITRKGGRDFNLTTTQDLKKAFNLREVQSGNWVLKDPTSAEFHVRNASNAFADLADVTGIGDDKISLNGRLAMAFGARGTGNAGGTTAMAHYEPVERVINLTKFKGGGCLGHEWFHAFDNMITSAMTGDNSIADVYLTNMYHGMTEANKLLLEEYVNLKDADSTYSNVYRKNQLKKQLEKKGVDVSEIDKSHKSALQIKVQNAFDDVVKAMTEGTEELMTTLTYEHKDYVNMISNMSDNVLQRYRDYYSSYSGDRKPMQLLIADAGSLDDAVRAINKRYEKYNDSKSIKNKRDWLKISAAYYDRKPDGTKGLQPLIIPSGKTGSQFLADAKDLDNQDGRAYWSETHEMAARAFSSYIEDTLQSMGRQNDYLAYASDNKYYGGDKPYPEGEERKRINAAFKKLFEVINSEQAIQKSIDILDNFIEKSEPRFIIKDGRFLVRK